jgi:hypothetical protein
MPPLVEARRVVMQQPVLVARPKRPTPAALAIQRRIIVNAPSAALLAPCPITNVWRCLQGAETTQAALVSLPSAAVRNAWPRLKTV